MQLKLAFKLEGCKGKKATQSVSLSLTHSLKHTFTYTHTINTYILAFGRKDIESGFLEQIYNSVQHLRCVALTQLVTCVS